MFPIYFVRSIFSITLIFSVIFSVFNKWQCFTAYRCILRLTDIHSLMTCDWMLYSLWLKKRSLHIKISSESKFVKTELTPCPNYYASLSSSPPLIPSGLLCQKYVPGVQKKRLTVDNQPVKTLLIVYHQGFFW